jgi:hypothetical protein
MNAERFGVWGTHEPYDYSYGVSCALSSARAGPSTPIYPYAIIDRDASSQILAADGTVFELYNFRADYVHNPDCAWDQPAVWANSVGFFHKPTSANMVCRDGSVRPVYYEHEGSGINTEEVFFWRRGESIDQLGEYPDW